MAFRPAAECVEGRATCLLERTRGRGALVQSDRPNEDATFIAPCSRGRAPALAIRVQR
jgi:hypothetical protein